jgi:hypothetical protein
MVSAFRPYPLEEEYGDVTAESSDSESSESEVDGDETVSPLYLNGSGSDTEVDDEAIWHRWT